MADDGGKVPMSPGLQATLLRAREYASSQSEAQVLLEHLLLALSEDADAAGVLEACSVDLGRLRNDVASYIGTLDDRVPPGTPGAPAISQALTQVLRYASLAAQQGRRTSIDGAIVLAALVGDGRSMAASFLKTQGLTFEAAIQALREAAARSVVQPDRPASSPAPGGVAPQHESRSIPAENGRLPEHYAAPGPLRADDILARARERVESRAQRTEPPHARMAPTMPPAASDAIDAPHDLPEAAPAATIADVSGAYDTSTDLSPTGPASQSLAPANPVEVPGGFRPAGNAHRTVPEEPATYPSEPAMPTAAAPSVPPAVAPARPELPPPVRTPAPPDPPLSGHRHPGDHQALPLRPNPGEVASPPLAPDRVAYDEPAQGWPREPVIWPSPPQPASWAPAPIRPPAQQSSHALRGHPPLLPPHAAPTPSFAEPPPHSPPRWPRTEMPPDPRHEPPAMLPDRGAPPPPLAHPQPNTGERGHARRPAIDVAQISHSMPRRMKQRRAHVIEVRIERPSLAGGSSPSRSYALRPETVVARAIAVRLRPLSGRFIIEAASPETQWDQSGAAGAGRLASEAAVWRFTVTPLKAGRGTLQLAIAARTLGADGVLAESQLPDQAHEIRISADYGRRALRAALLVAVGIGSVAVLKTIEALVGLDLYYLLKQLLRF